MLQLRGRCPAGSTCTRPPRTVIASPLQVVPVTWTDSASPSASRSFASNVDHQRGAVVVRAVGHRDRRGAAGMGGGGGREQEQENEQAAHALTFGQKFRSILALSYRSPPCRGTSFPSPSRSSPRCRRPPSNFPPSSAA